MVMVSHRHQFIFLKTRKTAGTSVEMVLEPWCRGPGAVVVEATPPIVSREGIVGRRLVPATRWTKLFRRTDWRNHMTAGQIRTGLGPEKWDRYQKITTVRNPFNLLVSLFHWDRSRRNQAEPDDFAETRAQFREALKTEYADFDFDHQIVHFKGRFAPDHVIRFENLQSDLDAAVAAVLPGQGPLILPHTKNIGRRKRSVADYFDRDSVEMVLKNASWVFERIGYPESPNDETSSSSQRQEVKP